jgi:aryl-alcohol dehydrogenase-like predicted oxidoreductase
MRSTGLGDHFCQQHPSRPQKMPRVALAKARRLLRRAPNILLIPGTSSVSHLKENLAATAIVWSDDVTKQLESVATKAA